MTVTDFQKDHGAEFQKLLHYPAMLAFIDLLRTISPAVASTQTMVGDVVVGGHVLYARVQGYHDIFNLLTTDVLFAPPKEQDIEADYEGDAT